MPTHARALLPLAAAALLACGDDSTSTTDAGARDASRDAVVTEDAPAPRDSSADGPGGDDGGGDADAGRPPALVPNGTLEAKLMMGYQGWFSAPGDGSTIDRWRHWSADATPNADDVTFDAWPDLSEYGADELFPTDLRYADDSVAGLYSAYTPATVDRHFAWMQEHGIDGVFLQHFVVELGEGTPAREFRDRVTANVRASAEAHGRLFAVMYDISGADEATIGDRLLAHWRLLVESGVTSSDRYLRHRGLPVVAVWGFGFSDRAGTPAQASALIAALHEGALAATVVGGIPSRWRTLTEDSQSDPAWADVYRSLDVISPWMVGRFGDLAGAESFRRDFVDGDIAECDAIGKDYLPVVWPGFSWTNLRDGTTPLNQIPRLGGRFYWQQVAQYVDAGATMLYGAMFDEVDEATAMFKIAETAADTPTTGTWLTLDADGEAIPSDFYLRLAGETSRLLRGERALTFDRPIEP